MLPILAALAPVCLVIALGHGLYRTRAIGEDVWSALEHVCYYLFFPALIVHTLARADFSELMLGRLVLGFMASLAAGSLILILAKPLLTRAFALSDAGFTSLFQGSTRWHGFMALAVVTALYGPTGVAVVAVGLAALVPVLNVINILVLLRWGDRQGAEPEAILGQLLRNPFIIACATGAVLNGTGIGLPEPIGTALKSIGDGALGVSLLTIGAGLRPVTAGGERGAIVFGILFRLILMPAIFFVCLTAFGVTGTVRTVGVICGAVPTAASAYVLARKLGGDAPLMASMITAQVLAAGLTLPLVILALEWLARS